MPTIKINEKEYEVTALKMKHLRQITEILKENKPNGLFNTVERWTPFILESIQAKNQGFKREDLEEATLEEMVVAWDTIVKVTGIKFIPGETKPAGSIGESSTGVSPAPSAGTTVQ